MNTDWLLLGPSADMAPTDIVSEPTTGMRMEGAADGVDVTVEVTVAIAVAVEVVDADIDAVNVSDDGAGVVDGAASSPDSPTPSANSPPAGSVTWWITALLSTDVLSVVSNAALTIVLATIESMKTTGTLHRQQGE